MVVILQIFILFYYETKLVSFSGFILFPPNYLLFSKWFYIYRTTYLSSYIRIYILVHLFLYSNQFSLLLVKVVREISGFGEFLQSQLLCYLFIRFHIVSTSKLWKTYIKIASKHSYKNIVFVFNSSILDIKPRFFR